MGKFWLLVTVVAFFIIFASTFWKVIAFIIGVIILFILFGMHPPKTS